MPSKVERQFHITSKMENLKKVRQFISQAVQDSYMDEKEKNNITLAVDEAVANIIKHGYKNQPSGIIEIEVSADQEVFQIEIIDTSPGFELDSIQDPDIEEHIKLGKNSGLGVYLIRKIMDQVEYKRDKKNHLIMKKFISAPKKN